MVVGKGTLSNGRWLSALQGRLINFEKRRKVSSRNLTGRGQVLGGEGGQSPTRLEHLVPPSPFLLHFGGELDTETVGELLPQEGSTGSRVKNSFWGAV